MSLIVNIKKKYKDFYLDVKFSSDKEMLGILGASGCGKTLTLKCIAGLLTPDEGYIVLNDRVLYDSTKKINLKPQQRKVGYLFQDYGLFPHMTVINNIVSVLKGKKNAKYAKASTLLEQFELLEYGNRYPWQLSGGQQQRVALARILACEPEAVLLDEPFSALDMYMREKMQIEMVKMLSKANFKEVIMVTHSREEVYRLTKKLMVINEGSVVVIEDTKKLFEYPRNHIAARLTGCKNISLARKLDETHVYAEQWDMVLKTNRVSEKITHVGIRAQDFSPSICTNDINRFSIEFLCSMENQFEWSIVLKNADAQNCGEMWWVYSKTLNINKMPKYLFVKTENILLLEK